MKIGFWGAGLMGSGLCRTLLRQGHQVLVFSRDQEKAKALAAQGPHGQAIDDRRDLALADVVISCVARPPYLKEAFLGPDGLYAKMKKSTLHIECSTIDPVCAGALEKEAKAASIDYVQATLGKTPAHAEKAEEPIFVGGEASAKSRAWPLLTEMGLPVDVGSSEASCAAKLISNLVGMTNIAVLAEGFKVGEACGLDPKTLLTILNDTGAHSFQMDVRGPMLAANNYDDVKFRLTLALKDVALGTDMAHVKNIAVPFFDAARAQFAAADEKGLGSLDCAAVGMRTKEK